MCVWWPWQHLPLSEEGRCQALLQAAEAVPCSVLPWAFFFGCKPSVPVAALRAPSDLLSKVKANSWMQCDCTLVWAPT